MSSLCRAWSAQQRRARGRIGAATSRIIPPRTDETPKVKRMLFCVPSEGRPPLTPASLKMALRICQAQGDSQISGLSSLG